MTEDSEFDDSFVAEAENPEEFEEETVEEETVEEAEFEEEDSSEFAEADAEPEQENDSQDEDEDFDKPVSEGEFVEVEVEDLGSKGDGIARKEGFVIFVPGGEVGETYEVEVTSVGRKFAFAEIAE